MASYYNTRVLRFDWSEPCTLKAWFKSMALPVIVNDVYKLLCSL